MSRPKRVSLKPAFGFSDWLALAAWRWLWSRASETVYKNYMQPLPTVLLRPGEADRILAGHPWIYHGSVLRLTNPAADGELVQVKDHRQRFLGVGLFRTRTLIFDFEL